MKRTQHITRLGLIALLAVLTAVVSPADDVFAQRRESRSKSRVEQRESSKKKKATRANDRVAQRQARTQAQKQAARTSSANSRRGKQASKAGVERRNGGAAARVERRGNAKDLKARSQQRGDRKARRASPRRDIEAVRSDKPRNREGVKRQNRRQDDVRRSPADRPPKNVKGRKNRVRRQAVDKPRRNNQQPRVKARQRNQGAKARGNVKANHRRAVKPNRYVKPKYRRNTQPRAWRHANRPAVKHYQASHRRYIKRHPNRWRTWVPHDYRWFRKRYYKRNYRPYRWYYKRHYYRHHRPVAGFYIHVPVYRYHTQRHSKTFVFRQVVETKANYAGGIRSSELDVRTTLRKRVRDVNRDRVKIEFEIERMSIWANGTFLGDVKRIPKHLRRVRAEVHNDGYVEFDRMVYLVGDPARGFELLSSKYYGGNLVENYERGHDVRVGWVDFGDRRVRDAEYSELFDPFDLQGIVPIELIPDDEQWGFQYLAGGHARSEGYFSGNYDYYSNSSLSDDGYYRRSSRANGFSADSNGFATVPGTESYSVATKFVNEGEIEYRGENDESLSVSRKVFIESVPN